MVDGTCIDIVALYLSSTPINVLPDLAIPLLPLPILTSLHMEFRMEFREKVILATTFIVGGLVTIVDVVRILYLQEALKEELLVNPSASITATTPPPNFTYRASFSLMWSVVEVSVGIMCCCDLVLKPLMGVMPKLLHAPHMHRHFPSGTPESLRSNTSEDGRSSDSSPVGDVQSPASVTAGHDSPRTGSRRVEPDRVTCVTPLARASPSFCGNRPTRYEEGEALDFFEMLTSEPSAEDPSAWPPLEGPSTHRKSCPRRSTIMSERRATVGTDPSQEPTQNFFDFVQVKGKVPLTQLSAKEA
ncbi:hypothetical protein JCM24511_02054 [Saitozyma sp. JCM 24511]|nr:hypothetical protein JCM24511_02054 [Saitozyma sp. JCM 24511]